MYGPAVHDLVQCVYSAYSTHTLEEHLLSKCAKV